MCILMSCYWYK